MAARGDSMWKLHIGKRVMVQDKVSLCDITMNTVALSPLDSGPNSIAITAHHHFGA